MNVNRSAGTCRWATPTLFLTAPFWFDAEECPWTCVHDPVPRVLSTTDPCATCPRWEPRRTTPPTRTSDQEGPGTVRETVPMMVDWFGAFPPPHEAD
jgi:hypothetical protein